MLQHKSSSGRKSPRRILSLICLAGLIICCCLFCAGRYREYREKAANDELARIVSQAEESAAWKTQSPNGSAASKDTAGSGASGDAADTGVSKDSAGAGASDPMESPALTDAGGMLVPYASLWQQNPDLGGWLRIENTIINYPVMYTPDDPEYYLYRAFDQSDSASGCLFIGESMTPDSSYILIHGHRMNNGTMFGELSEYADEEYAREHSVIRFDSLYEEREYKVLAAFYSKVYYQSDTDVFRYYAYTNLDSEETFNEFYSYLRDSALYLLDGAEYGDDLLALSTCSYHTDNGRFVVIAKRIREIS